MTEWTEQPLPRSPIGARLIAGIVLAAAGILMTADNLDLLESENWFRYWSVSLIVIGLLKLFAPGTRVFAILLIVVGSWILAYNLGLFPFTIFDLWPLLLIGIGAALVLRSVAGDKPAASPAESEASSVAILSTRRIAPTGPWAGGKAVAFMSTLEIDLSRAEIGSAPVILETLAIWSGIVITVPSGWEVVGEVAPIMGGFEQKTTGHTTEPRRRFIIRGLAMMAGIEVKTAERSAS